MVNNIHEPDFRAFEIEYRIQNEDGIYEYILCRGKVMERDNAGRVIRVIGTFTDINELKLYEARLNIALETAVKGFGSGTMRTR